MRSISLWKFWSTILFFFVVIPLVWFVFLKGRVCPNQCFDWICIDIFILYGFKECALLHFLCAWEPEFALGASFSFCSSAANTNSKYNGKLQLIWGFWVFWREFYNNNHYQRMLLVAFLSPWEVEFAPGACFSFCSCPTLTVMTIIITILKEDQ